MKHNMYVSFDISWISLYMDGTAVNLLQLIFPQEAGTLDPNYTLGVDFLDHDFFIILKNSHQELSNEGSNFILTSLEVGH